MNSDNDNNNINYCYYYYYYYYTNNNVKEKGKNINYHSCLNCPGTKLHKATSIKTILYSAWYQ